MTSVVNHVVADITAGNGIDNERDPWIKHFFRMR